MKILYRLGCVLLCLQLTGCAGMHLYSEKRDQQGKDLKQAWAKVDLPGYFDAMQQQRKNLLQAQLDTLASVQAAQADSLLETLARNAVGDVGAPQPGTLLSDIDKEFHEIMGAGKDDELRNMIESLEAAQDQLGINREKQAAYRQMIQVQGSDGPTCASLLSDKAMADSSLSTSSDISGASIKQLKTLCDKEKTIVAQQRTQLQKMDSSAVLKNAFAVAEKMEEEMLRDQQRDEPLITQYRTAMKEYEAAVNQSVAGTPPSERLATASQVLRSVLGAVEIASNGVARKVVANDRLAKIESILAKVGDTSDPDQTASRGEVAAVMISRIADDVQLYAQLQKPVIPASLLIDLNLQKITVQQMRDNAGYALRRLDLSRAIIDSHIKKAALLSNARNISRCPSQRFGSMVFMDAVWLSKPVTAADERRQVIEKSPPYRKLECKDGIAIDRADLYKAAGHYLQAVGPQTMKTKQLLHLRGNIGYEQSINAAQFNAQRWAILIDMTVGQSAQYAATGQKISDYDALAQFFALVWIGKGVRK